MTKHQQINLPNTYSGLAWARDGTGFYVSGGNNDRVYVYKFNGIEYVPPFILLGHDSNQTAPIPRPDGGLLKGTKAAEVAPLIVVGGESPSGIGWFARQDPQGRRYLEITGSNAGVQAGLRVYPDEDVEVAVLANTWGTGSQSGEMVTVLPEQLAAACLR